MEYKNSFKNIITPLIVAIALVVGVGIGISIGKHNLRNRGDRFISGGNDKLSSIISLIKSQYVDTVDMDSIAESVIPVILEKLDPHSTYISAKELADVNEPLEGQFDGIGVTFNMMTDTVVILNVINGGPSQKAGLHNGDRIIAINDSIVAGKKIEQNNIVKKLRGVRGTEVNLGIERQGVKGLLPITVTRGVIPVKSLDASFMIEPEIGYIKLSRFSRNSHTEILEAVKKLKEQGMAKLIFDLRGNSGGFLDQAHLIANEFLPANSLIVYTEGKAKKRKEFLSDGKGKLKDIPLSILIDEGSASASEIVAGAIQDNDRGTVVGRRSFGKGLVQEQIPFIDGSAIRLTVSRYYTPLGRSIQKPYDKGVEAYYNELEVRFNHKELFSADSIKFNDSLKFTTPAGKIVYGGGGIMPDIFVAADTSGYNSFVQNLIKRNIILKFSLAYSDKHRAELNKIDNFDKLNDYFVKNRSIFNEFITYAETKKITPKNGELTESKELIDTHIKAYIGRNTPLEDNAFYMLISPVDTVIKKTVSVFK